MAINVYNRKSAREFVGLSTDTKPVSTHSGNGAIAPPGNGDRFIETDTGKIYVFNAGAWSAAISGAVFVAGG